VIVHSTHWAKGLKGIGPGPNNIDVAGSRLRFSYTTGGAKYDTWAALKGTANEAAMQRRAQ